MALEEYAGDMNMCCRCSTCKFIPLQMVKGFKHANVCPSISRYNFHFFSAGGRLNLGANGLKNGFNYTPWYLSSIYNCQMCGACDVSCKYGMDMEVLRPVQEMRIKSGRGRSRAPGSREGGRPYARDRQHGARPRGASAATGPKGLV